MSKCEYCGMQLSPVEMNLCEGHCERYDRAFGLWLLDEDEACEFMHKADALMLRTSDIAHETADVRKA